MGGLETMYAFNPGTKRGSRKVRKSKKRGHRRSAAQRAATKRMIAAMRAKRAGRSGPRRKSRKGSRKARRGARKLKPKKRGRKGGALRSIKFHGHKVSRKQWSLSGYSRNKGKKKYRRNPGGGGGNFGLGALSVPQVLPFSIPAGALMGLGKYANAGLQAVGAGALFMTGYLGAGYAVDLVASKEQASAWAAAGDWRGKFARPGLFALSAGLTGALTAAVWKFIPGKSKPNRTLLVLASAAGPGVRAFAGFLAALMPQGPDDSSFWGRLKGASVQLADYITVGDDDDMGDYIVSDNQGNGDYITVGDNDGTGAIVTEQGVVTAAVGDSVNELDDNGMED